MSEYYAYTVYVASYIVLILAATPLEIEAGASRETNYIHILDHRLYAYAYTLQPAIYKMDLPRTVTTLYQSRYIQRMLRITPGRNQSMLHRHMYITCKMKWSPCCLVFQQ